MAALMMSLIVANAMLSFLTWCIRWDLGFNFLTFETEFVLFLAVLENSFMHTG